MPDLLRDNREKKKAAWNVKKKRALVREPDQN
jgi:hypothetical protein